MVRLSDCDMRTDLVTHVGLPLVFQSHNRSVAGKVTLCLSLGNDHDFQRTPEPRGQVQLLGQTLNGGSEAYF